MNTLDKNTEYYNNLHNKIANKFNVKKDFIIRLRVLSSEGLSPKEIIIHTAKVMSLPRNGGKHRKAVQVGWVKKDKRRNNSVKYYQEFLNFIASLTNEQYNEIINTEN